MNQDKDFEKITQLHLDEGVICPRCNNTNCYCPVCEGFGFVAQNIADNYIKEQKNEKDYEPQ